MNTVLRLPKGFAYHLLYVLLLPAFHICFCFLYNPFSMQDFYDVGGKNFAFHYLMVTCIIIGVLVITRVVLWALYRYVNFLWWHYGVWCIGEVVVMSFFTALYTALFYGREMPYFLALSHCLKFNSLILVYPYVFMILVRLIILKSQEVYSARSAGEEGLMKFYDEHKRLKLTIDPSVLLFIGAESNYVKIHYLENDRHKEFLLRNSMKSLEEPASRYGLVRCHRSFYVNPRHIRVLSRGKDGVILAELVHDGIKPLPVSKQYYDKLSELL